MPPSRIAVVADSSTCLPPDVISSLGIRVVSIPLTIGDEEFRDGELDAAQLFARTDSTRKVASTAAPSPGEFLDSFRQAGDAGAEAIICLTLASDFSGTHDAALAAVELARKDIPALSVRVVDTGVVAALHGFAVETAARVVHDGGGVGDAEAAARAAAERSTLIGALDSLDYLVRSGRIPWLVGRATSLLRVRPVIVFDGGRPRRSGQTRSMEKAISRMVDLTLSRSCGRTAAVATVLHTVAPDLAARLAGETTARLECSTVRIQELTSAMAIHTGPRFLGLAVMYR